MVYQYKNINSDCVLVNCNSYRKMKLALVISLSCLLLVGANCCVQNFHELEEWVIQNEDNLDNLTTGFFPANLQPSYIVEIFYHVNGTSWDYKRYPPRPAQKDRECAKFTQLPSTSCRYIHNH